MVASNIANVCARVRFPLSAPILCLLSSGCASFDTTVYPKENFDAFIGCEKVWETRPLVENGPRVPDVGFFTPNDHLHYHCRVDKLVGFSYRL